MANHQILIIHQSDSIGENINHILTQGGYKVVVTKDPQFADSLIQDHIPDLVLIGFDMGDIDGYEFRSRYLDSQFNLPFVVIVNQESMVSDLKAAGWINCDYVSLPITSEALLITVRQALERRDRVQPNSTESIQERSQVIIDRLAINEQLQNINLSLASLHDMDDIIKSIVNAAIDLTNADQGSLWLLEDSTGDLYLRADRKFQDKFPNTRYLSTQDAHAIQVMRTGKAVKSDHNTILTESHEGPPYSYIYVPIQTSDHVYGVLGVDNHIRMQLLTDDDLFYISSLADISALAIENERRYTQCKWESNQLKAIITDLTDGVIVFDLDSRILLVNSVARSIFGIDETNLIGKAYQEVFQHSDMLEIFDNHKSSTDRTEISIEDGRIFNVNITSIPDVGYAFSMQEITHLKELDQIKTDFVNTVSHDLRSPLTAILGYVELISRAGPINAQQHEFVKRIEMSVNNITMLIDDLLDLGRIEAGFDARKEIVHIPMIIQYAVDGLSNQIMNKEQVVEVDCGKNLPPVLGNPVRLRQMFNNLLTNAIKYTPEKGYVSVSAHEESQQIIIHVSDNGPGIPIADQPYIFDKFYRGSNVPLDTPGTGLGLAIVKSIIDNHLGRIWVDSIPGTGTTFTIVLPITDLKL